MGAYNTITEIRRKKNQRLAAMLDELETTLGQGNTFTLVRKIVLDFFNDYYRDILRLLLGIEVEGQG